MTAKELDDYCRDHEQFVESSYNFYLLGLLHATDGVQPDEYWKIKSQNESLILRCKSLERGMTAPTSQPSPLLWMIEAAKAAAEAVVKAGCVRIEQTILAELALYAPTDSREKRLEAALAIALKWMPKNDCSWSINRGAVQHGQSGSLKEAHQKIADLTAALRPGE